MQCQSETASLGAKSCTTQPLHTSQHMWLTEPADACGPAKERRGQPTARAGQMAMAKHLSCTQWVCSLYPQLLTGDPMATPRSWTRCIRRR